MNKIIHDFTEIVTQFRFVLNRKQKITSFSILCIIIIGAGFETIGVSAILPFVQALMSPEVLMKNPIVHRIMSMLSITSTIDLILLVGGCVIAIYLIKNAYLSFSTYAQIRFQNTVERELSVHMLSSYLKRPYAYFLNVNSSDIIRNVESDVNGLYGMVGACLRIITEGLTALLIGIFIFYQDPYMALGVTLLAGTCFVGTAVGFKPIMKKSGIKSRAYAAQRYKHIYQATNGIKEIKVMNRADYFTNNYEQAFLNYQKPKQIQTFLAAVPEKIIEAVCVCGLIGIVCYRMMQGGVALDYLPQLATFAVAAFRILPSVARIASNFNDLVYYKPSVDAVERNLREVQAYEQYLLEYGSTLQDTENQQARQFKHQVTLTDIVWTYPGSDKRILNHLNLTIEKGQSVGFIGASGAGKTTTADIILGLLHPQQGKVEMDGIDIFQMVYRWSRIIGYVPQAVFITDDTIRNNVAFGIDADEIEDMQVWAALDQAQLKDFVEQLPEGLDTELGERGVRFSGGQKQRVAIARALYYNPEILVLDEATAALDNETEAALMESIEVLQGKKTLIIVAHRLTTIKNCNKVYEFVDGKAFVRT